MKSSWPNLKRPGAFFGPFGGDGGNGGDAIFEADPGMTTLLDLRYHRKVIATPG